MSYQELPADCRQCWHRQSRYLYPAWDHTCLKAKPMVGDCPWHEPRHPNFEELHHAGTRDET